MAQAVGVTPERPILIDRFLQHATECEADAISDGEHVFVPAVMEHIELAGIHSGDSACIVPSMTIPEKHVATIKEYTKKMARALGVKGLMNMQYAIADDKVYVLEANPRASRTVPLVSKVCNINMVRAATEIITSDLTGKKDHSSKPQRAYLPPPWCEGSGVPLQYVPRRLTRYWGPRCVPPARCWDFPTPLVLRSSNPRRLPKLALPTSGSVLISVNDSDKDEVVELGRGFEEVGFKIYATRGTYNLLKANGVNATLIKKLHEGRPNIVDAITNGEINLVINTPIGKQGSNDDSYIRKAAIKNKVIQITTMAAAKAAVIGIKAASNPEINKVKSLQQYHKEIIEK